MKLKDRLSQNKLPTDDSVSCAKSSAAGLLAVESENEIVVGLEKL